MVALNGIGFDGVDHINVYSKGKTELGRLLSNSAHTPFYGFESVEGWWYWYLSGKRYDILKSLYGRRAKDTGRKYPRVNTIGASLLKKVYHLKVACNPSLKRMLCKSTLPFTHYYVYGDRRVETHNVWTGELWNEVRAELQRGWIVELAPHQVFIFGTNMDGFHGAGSAGYAMLHVRGNAWRRTYVPGTKKYLKEIPFGTKGYWAVKGIARGLQEGLYGKSYGIQTVHHIYDKGDDRKVSCPEIQDQLVTLWEFANTHPDLEFLMTPIGAGLGGHTKQEMHDVLMSVINTHVTPTNIVIPDNMYSLATHDNT